MKTWTAGLFALVLAIGLWPMAQATANPSGGAARVFAGTDSADYPHVGHLLLAKEHDDQGNPHEQYEGEGEHHKGHKRDHANGPEEAERGNFQGPFFQRRYVPYFRGCYAADTGHLPPGLQKHIARTGHLPPGLEMQVECNGHLPPGLEKRLVPASSCLTRRIGPLPPNTRLYLLGRDALLLNEHTRAIVDILRGAY